MATMNQQLHIKINNAWHTGAAWIKVNGTWKQITKL